MNDNDLMLCAVRYIGGEMSAAEFDAFERRLAEDQDAREAVEFAVRLAMAVADLAPVTVPEAALPARRRRAGLWIAASVLSAAGIVAGWCGLFGGPAVTEPAPDAVVEQPRAVTDAELLIESWIDFGDVAGVEEQHGADLEVDESVEFGLDESEAPAWLMQGLAK